MSFLVFYSKLFFRLSVLHFRLSVSRVKKYRQTARGSLARYMKVLSFSSGSCLRCILCTQFQLKHPQSCIWVHASCLLNA